MKKELAFLATIHVASLSLVSWLWIKPVILLGSLMIVAALMLCRWHQKGDLLSYASEVVPGTLGEAMASHLGAWQYSNPLFLLPTWLLFLWGNAALF